MQSNSFGTDGGSDSAGSRQAPQTQTDQHFEALADTISQMAWVAGPDGYITWYNRRWYEYTGTTFDQMAGWGWQSVHDPELLPSVLEKWRESIATGESFEMEFPLRGADGTFRMFLTRAQPLKDAQGRVLKWFGTNTDITEMKRIEEAQSLLAAIVTSSNDAILSEDITGKILTWNDGAKRLFGYTAEEMIGQSIKRLLPPGDREEEKIFAPLRQSANELQIETIRLAKDGRQIPVSVTASPTFSRDGQLIGVSKILRDISERKRAEKELRDSEERMQLATAATGVGIWHWNVKNGSVAWDGQMFEIYGVAPSSDGSVRYSTWSNAVVPEELAEQERSLEELLRRGGQNRREFHIRRIDNGEIRLIQSVETVRKNDSGEVEWVVGTNLDITDRRRGEDILSQSLSDLASAKAEAEAANKAKDRFLAVLSHELRTPLTPVLVAAGELARDQTLSPEHRETMQMIRRNVELESGMINDLLDITRITREKLELHREIVDVHQAIQQVVEMSRDEGMARKVQFELNLRAADVCVQADPMRLGQILWNLVNNAMKFSVAPARVIIETTNPTPGRLALFVMDTGIGIAPEKLAHIFDPFEQGGRDVTRKFGGLGLGLSISKSLVELHGGVITAASDGPGKGATFAVELSTCRPAIPADRPQKPGTQDNLKLTILLAEDHADTRKIMAKLLQAMGCTVKMAGTVAEALDIAAQHKLDLVVSDIGLPDAPGTELMRELKTRYGLRGIALSGYGTHEDLAKSKACGFSRHLVKPVDFQLLQRAIRDIAAEQGL